MVTDKDKAPSNPPEQLPNKYTLYVEAARANVHIIAESSPAPDGSILVEGTALFDNVISLNERYYSKEFNDRLISNTERFMAEGGRVTTYSSHEKAYGGYFSSEGLPVGKIPKVFREGNVVKYHMRIFPTSEGSDIITLLRGEGIDGTSIRMDPRSVKSRTGKINEQDVEVMEDATLAGIDFASYPGVPGAGVGKILESAPTVVFTAKTHKQEDDMEWADITIEQITEKRKDLLDKMAAAAVAEQAKTVQGLQDKLAESSVVIEELKKTAANTDEGLKTQIAGLQAEKVKLELEVAILNESLVGPSKMVLEALRAANPADVESVKKQGTEARNAAVTKLFESAGVGQPGNAGGTTKPPVKEKPKSDESGEPEEGSEMDEYVRLSRDTR